MLVVTKIKMFCIHKDALGNQTHAFGYQKLAFANQKHSFGYKSSRGSDVCAAVGEAAVQKNKIEAKSEVRIHANYQT